MKFKIREIDMDLWLKKGAALGFTCIETEAEQFDDYDAANRRRHEVLDREDYLRLEIIYPTGQTPEEVLRDSLECSRLRRRWSNVQLNLFAPRAELPPERLAKIQRILLKLEERIHALDPWRRMEVAA